MLKKSALSVAKSQKKRSLHFSNCLYQYFQNIPLSKISACLISAAIFVYALFDHCNFKCSGIEKYFFLLNSCQLNDNEKKRNFPTNRFQNNSKLFSRFLLLEKMKFTILECYRKSNTLVLNTIEIKITNRNFQISENP